MHRHLRNLILIPLITLTAIATAEASEQPEKLFEGAPLDEDGLFTNTAGNIGHGTLGDRVPFIIRRFGTYFRSAEDAPTVVLNDGAYLRENVAIRKPTVTWVGHATLLVQMDNISFLTDPTWSNRPSPIPLIGPKRYVKPGIKIEDLPKIDFVVISHNHYDHLDVPTLKLLAKRDDDTMFLVPLGNGDLLRKNGIGNVEELNWGDTRDFEGLTIHSLPSQHWSKRSLSDERKALWSSWAVTSAERRFYFAGDTGYFSGFAEIGEKLGPFDLVAVPIGAYEPVSIMRESHMNPEEAMQAAKDLKGTRAVAIHFGTFDLTDEPLAEPPQRFKKAGKANDYKAIETWILDIGETREF
ncbi:MAG: N-acyl-phosphatidylethanolamine-hydrolyzing phospholipase D [Halioglobus sp.]|jgi:N-acyl-phosphatidylethanolamine-hydrolysing phospholipase D